MNYSKLIWARVQECIIFILKSFLLEVSKMNSISRALEYRSNRCSSSASTSSRASSSSGGSGVLPSSSGRTMRRKRLVRSEHAVDCSAGWDSLIRESILQMAWPINLASDDTISVHSTTFGVR